MSSRIRSYIRTRGILSATRNTETHWNLYKKAHWLFPEDSTYIFSPNLTRKKRNVCLSYVYFSLSPFSSSAVCVLSPPFDTAIHLFKLRSPHGCGIHQEAFTNIQKKTNISDMVKDRGNVVKCLAKPTPLYRLWNRIPLSLLFFPSFSFPEAPSPNRGF